MSPLLLLSLLACRQADIGITAVDKQLTVTPLVTDFGAVPVGATRESIVEFYSIAGGDIEVRSLTLINVDGDSFALSDPEPFIVPADNDWLVQAEYMPEEPGFHRAILEIISESTTPRLQITLRGFASEHRVRVYPAVVDFGPMAVGESSTAEITVDNQGEIDVELASADVLEPFSVVDASWPVTIPAGESVPLTVSADPVDLEETVLDMSIDAGPYADVPSVELRVNACSVGLPSLYDADADGFTSCAGDCDDGDPDTRPGAPEIIDDADQDCDGRIDEGTDAFDDDGDGASELDGDCNDGDPAVSPTATEFYGNGIDDDCDGTVDLGTTDADSDGVAPGGGDCNDSDATIGPGMPEKPDGIDQDCDGTLDEETRLYDDDGDGYCEDLVACTDASHLPGDCDDTGPAATDSYPGAVELADGIDNDCDGDIDEDTERDDTDGDGFSELGGDCDDADPAVSPSRTEVPGNGKDDDCDAGTPD